MDFCENIVTKAKWMLLANSMCNYNEETPDKAKTT